MRRRAHPILKCLATALLAASLAVGLAAPGRADVYVWIEAWFEINVHEPAERVESPRFRVTGHHAGSDIEAAKHDARWRLGRCLDHTWTYRTGRALVSACTGGGRSAAGVWDFPYPDIMAGLSRLACSAVPDVEYLFTNVSVWVEGGPSERPLEGIAFGEHWIRLHCKQPAEIMPRLELERPGPAPREIVPLPRLEPALQPPLPGIRLPGNDLRRIWIDEDDWTRCEALCTGACRAWTWRAPGTSGPGSQAACLLKSAAGWQVPDACCHSGLKD